MLLVIDICQMFYSQLHLHLQMTVVTLDKEKKKIHKHSTLFIIARHHNATSGVTEPVIYYA